MDKKDKPKPCACRSCHCTKFIPTKTPRYNKIGTTKNVWMSDLILYNKHRKKCFYAEAQVDTKPPPLNLMTKLKPAILYRDACLAQEVDRQNKNMLTRLVRVERIGGAVDTVNSLINLDLSNWGYHKGKMKQIDEENKRFYRKISKATSFYKYDKGEWKYYLRILSKLSNYPVVILKKEDLDQKLKAHPSISLGLPKISNHVEYYMDFTISNGEYLGRIILELYHEIAPLPCQDFFDFCEDYNQNTTKNIIIQRIFKDRYFESSFITNNKIEKHRKEDFRYCASQVYKMKHSKIGTISMVCDEKRMNNLKFCVTFCPMPELDRRNIVFGKLTKGVGVLMKINGYSRKIGKPLETITISACGELPECVCYKKMIKCKELS